MWIDHHWRRKLNNFRPCSQIWNLFVNRDCKSSTHLANSKNFQAGNTTCKSCSQRDSGRKYAIPTPRKFGTCLVRCFGVQKSSKSFAREDPHNIFAGLSLETLKNATINGRNISIIVNTGADMNILPSNLRVPLTLSQSSGRVRVWNQFDVLILFSGKLPALCLWDETITAELSVVQLREIVMLCHYLSRNLGTWLKNLSKCEIFTASTRTKMFRNLNSTARKQNLHLSRLNDILPTLGNAKSSQRLTELPDIIRSRFISKAKSCLPSVLHGVDGVSSVFFSAFLQLAKCICKLFPISFLVFPETTVTRTTLCLHPAKKNITCESPGERSIEWSEAQKIEVQDGWAWIGVSGTPLV